MKQWLLFISKQERTLDEIQANLKRFFADTEIPETFFGDLSDPQFASQFDDAKKQYTTFRVDALKKELVKAKKSHQFASHIRILEEKLAEEEAYNKAVRDNDMIGWLAFSHLYVRDGKIYTTYNGQTSNGFIDRICETTSQFLTDIEGNKVESCACRNLNLDTLDDIYALAYVVYEDSDEYSMYVTGEYFEDAHQDLIDSIPLDSYARIVEFHVHD